MAIQPKNSISRIAEIWSSVGVVPAVVSSDTKLFCGKSAPSSMSEESFLTFTSFGVWGTQDLFMAGKYAYFRGGTYRAVARLFPRVDFPVLQFPDSFHPADAASEFHKRTDGTFVIDYSRPVKGLDLQGLPPDVFISKNWSALVAEYGTQEAQGHIRYSCEEGENRGSQINEIWVASAGCMRVDRLAALPQNKDEWRSFYERNQWRLEQQLFSN